MKNRLFHYSIVLLVFSLGCSGESEVDKAWKSIDTGLAKERLETKTRDTLNVLWPLTPNDVALDINNLFEHQKISHQDSTVLNLASLKAALLQIEEIPDTCRNVILETLSDDYIKYSLHFHLDSVQSKILNCVSTELVEKELTVTPQN